MERPHVYPYPWNPNANTGGTIYELSDTTLAVGAAMTAGTSVNTVPGTTFCAGHAMGPNGEWFVAGGDQPYVVGKNTEGRNGLRAYTPCAAGSPATCVGTWQVYTPMSSFRWYPTVTTLYDGSFIIVGGSFSNLADQLDQNNPTYEYYPPKTTGTWPRQLQLLKDASMLYPLVYQLPSGKIFMFANIFAILLDPVTEEITNLPSIPNALFDHGPWSYPFTATGVVLPLSPANNYTATVQICGGPRENQLDAAGLPYASPICVQIKPEDPQGATWVRVDDMPHARVMPDVVLLPNGALLYTNGGGVGLAGGDAGTGRAYNPLFQCDIFYPTRAAGQQWDANQGLSVVPRLYHSGALLQKDGRVATSGSDQQNYVDKWGPTGTGPRNMNCWPDGTVVCTDPFEYRFEVYTPPYLLTGATRPTISAGPATVAHGGLFTITTSATSGIAKVVLIRYASTTHSTNTDQRYIELVIRAKRTTEIDLTAPPTGAVAPPGFWMMFAVTAAGVPSVARDIKITVSATSTPAKTCTGLVVDNFVGGAANNLGGVTGDDGTSQGAAVITNGRLTFTPKADLSTYFYENLNAAATCVNIGAYRYVVLSVLTPAANAEFKVELGTGCTGAPVRFATPAITIPAGTTQLLAIDLQSLLTPAQRAAVRAISFSGIKSDGTSAWKIGGLKLVDSLNGCGVSGARVIGGTTQGQTCQGTLVDDFTVKGTNTLNQAASDDNTMTTAYTVTANALRITPNTNSYFYENLGCYTPPNPAYAVFSVSTTATNASFKLEIQSGCTAVTARTPSTAITGLSTTAPNLIAVDLRSFVPTMTTLRALVWNGFVTTTGTVWEFKNLQIMSDLNACGFGAARIVTAGGTCTRKIVDQFAAAGTNALGAARSDDATMVSLAITANQLRVVPRTDGTSYFYETLSPTANTCIDTTATPYLVFTIQTTYTAASFSMYLETGCGTTAVVRTPVTGFTGFSGTAGVTYAVRLSSYLTAAQIAQLKSVSWRQFTSDGATQWTLTNVQLVSDLSTCGFGTATVLGGTTTTANAASAQFAALRVASASTTSTTSTAPAETGAQAKVVAAAAPTTDRSSMENNTQLLKNDETKAKNTSVVSTAKLSLFSASAASKPSVAGWVNLVWVSTLAVAGWWLAVFD
ncbi:hypothetical protein HDV00_010185 [Rhizophlyctis rosea]|nr:hypothetical protein HDV00_010185 [Rhizophlyctis rosea]